MSSQNPKRVTVSVNHPVNELFKYALECWKVEEEKNGNKYLAFGYNKAHKSVKKYVLPLSSGTEAKILECVGDGIAKKLDWVLERYKTTFGFEPCFPHVKEIKSKKVPFDVSKVSAGMKRSVSASSAKLSSENGPIPKATKAARASSVSASTNGLLANDRHPNYQGTSVAGLTRLKSESFKSFTLRPNEFEILLIVDQAEKRASLIKCFESIGVKFAYKTLPVGDYVWIARSIANPEQELLLDYIIERKRRDDFAHSIKGGTAKTGKKSNRWVDQKIRLGNCGLSRCIYLLEKEEAKIGGRMYVCLPESTLEVAARNAHLHDHFYVKKTNNGEETARYLGLLTQELRKRYLNKVLISSDKESHNVSDNDSGSCTLMAYKSFATDSKKTKPLSVRELFIRQLMVMQNVTYSAASAISHKYPGFHSILTALHRAPTHEQQVQLIADIPYYAKSRKRLIGATLGASIVDSILGFK